MSKIKSEEDEHRQLLERELRGARVEYEILTNEDIEDFNNNIKTHKLYPLIKGICNKFDVDEREMSLLYIKNKPKVSRRGWLW